MLFSVKSFTIPRIQSIKRKSASFVYRNSKKWSSSTTEEWSMDKVRSEFINYFVKDQGHTFYESSKCIPPPSDTSLLFTNAGMNQYKSIFLNQIPPNTPLVNLKRATNSQKCIRAGGKHNDLEDVGKDTYHHTFFEMLGSWSFGDYFKEEAVDMAWDLLVNVYKLDKERLYVTYFEGDDKVPKDEEVIEYWSKYLPLDRIIACDAKDNFWEMGDTGPCGPCTEIHYDRVGGRDASSLVNQDDPDVIEIWNVVFIQYNREDADTLMSLPLKHIDTGMGLERLTSILQNKQSNYDIDAFSVLIHEIEKLAGVGKYQGLTLTDDVDLKDTAYRAVADHLRTLSFAIADGAMPNNEGRGYVLRRILRRAARYGMQILQCKSGFMEQLVPIMVQTYGDFYPELKVNENKIKMTLREEETSFSTLLERGIKYFTNLQQELGGDNKIIPGDEAFFMYDTLGFPIDLTNLMAEEAGLTVDNQSFLQAMEQQKQRSRDARIASKNLDGINILTLGTEDVAVLERLDVSPSDDQAKYQWDISTQSTVLSLYNNRNDKVDSIDLIDDNASIGLVLDKTSFYAEAGGQDCDTGILSITDPETNQEIDILQIHDVQSYGDYILHVGTVIPSSLKTISLQDNIMCKVDYQKRRKIAPNHTMTHILNAALRNILKSNDDIEQRGSLVTHDKLRFDFSYGKALTTKELVKVEKYVNDIIHQELQVMDQIMPLEDAKKIPGVCAVFGEVYPDPVRVVRVDGIEEDVVESVEFCGGTHLKNTKEAESFIIVEETAVAKGIRRITAFTRDAAKEANQMGEEMEQTIAQAEEQSSKMTPEDLESKAVSLRKELEALTISSTLKPKLRTRIETLQKKSIDLKKKALAGVIDTYVQSLKDDLAKIADEQPFVFLLEDDKDIIDSKSIPKIMNSLKGISPTTPFLGIVKLTQQSKVLVFNNVPKDKTSTLKARDWLNVVLQELGGKGGGRDENAQGQAAIDGDVDFDKVIDIAKEFANEKIGLTV